MADKDKKVYELEKDIVDIIARFKGCHMNYICNQSYESIRLLKCLADSLSKDCYKIMLLQYEDKYRNDETIIQ